MVKALKLRFIFVPRHELSSGEESFINYVKIYEKKEYKIWLKFDF